MGNTSSLSSTCAVCSTSDTSRISISPGCCDQSYHMECLQSHLATRNTTCLKCHQVLPARILDLHQASQTPQTILPHAQAIPAQAHIQQPNFLNLPPPPAHVVRPTKLEPSKEMCAEEVVEAWNPSPASTPAMAEPREVQVLVEASPEVPQASFSAVTGFHSVVSVSASSRSIADDSNSAPPMDIVCILDVSGSMSSDNKLNNLKCAVNFMRDELKDHDRMSVITFEGYATRIHGLLKMTPTNKGRTEAHINGMRPGGGTRILTGLQEALQVLQSRQSRNPISSVFLLTDGQDPSDLREKKMIAKSIKEMGASLFVYGFGNDHDSQHLKTIADAGEGTFTFVEKSDMVIDAFGGALGAEKSIFAQNLSLTVTAASGARITSVHAGNYRKVITPSGNAATVYFPNLMQGEQRDVLVALDLAAVTEHEEVHSILTTELTYTRLDGQAVVNHPGQACCTISRVGTVNANLERNINVDVQVNRALLDSSTAASLALADQGNYEVARTNLTTTLNLMKESTSCQSHNAKTVAFVSELEATISNLQNEDVYRRMGGRSMMAEMASNINQQRCTYTKSGRSNAYQNEASLDQQFKTQTKKKAMFSRDSKK